MDVTGRNSSLADYECRVTLYDQDGAAFTSNYITSQTEKIKVSVPIYRVNNIPLTVTLKGRRQPDAESGTVRHRPGERRGYRK